MQQKPTPSGIFKIGFGFWEAKALLSAVELGVFTELAKGPAGLEALSCNLGLHERSARDFLDALVALKLLERQNGLYSNTAETDLFLDKAKPSYVGGLLEMANARLYASWSFLTEALTTGQNQSEGKDTAGLFAALYADPDKLRSFLAAMSGVSLGAAQAIATKFPWKNYKSFADIGTAQGMVPATLTKAIRIFPAPDMICPQSNPSLRSLSQSAAFRTGSDSSAETSLKIPCPAPMSSSWVTFSMIGTLRKSACCSTKPMRHCHRAARLSSMRRSSTTSGARMRLASL